MLLSLIGFVIFLSSFYLVFFLSSKIWYSFFVIGGFLFLEGFNSRKDFSILKDFKKFIFIWFVFALIGVLLEIIGNFYLDKWDYPNYSKLDYIIHVVLIGYPFVGFFAMELFVFLEKQLSVKYFNVI